MSSQSTNVDESDREARLTMRLLDLTISTDYELVQENGQRRLTAPELTSETRERARGSEIFLGRLPRDCYEDELVPVLQKIGRLLELRLMLDFSGSTRGYAFALYESPSVARRACRELDGRAIRPGHKIGVVKSIDNCRLFFGGVPRDKTRADFLHELGKLLDGITEIYVYPDPHDRRLNRGFIFVEFKDHRAAAMARRRLIPGKVVLWNHEIAVDWADPEPGEPVDDDVMMSVTALFVRNLTVGVPHQTIREIFETSTGVPVVKLKKINHFAFVHYETRELAQYVLDIMTQPGSVAVKQNWEIRWAKPILRSSKIVERQRSINEAMTNGRKDGPARGPAPKSADKRRGKKTNSDSKNANPSSKVDHRCLLEALVSENFGAICRFDVYATISCGHVCEITIAGDGNVPILSFQGTNYESPQSAIDETSRDVYRHIRYALENNCSLPRSNDLLGFDIADVAHQNKIEASR